MQRKMQEKLSTPQKNTNVKFDFIKSEIDFILENANFNEIQEKVFNRLTDKKGRQSIVQISLEENISTATVSRIIKQIKKKIYRLL